jgi:hypothetical protein
MSTERTRAVLHLLLLRLGLAECGTSVAARALRTPMGTGGNTPALCRGRAGFESQPTSLLTRKTFFVVFLSSPFRPRPLPSKSFPPFIGLAIIRRHTVVTRFAELELQHDAPKYSGKHTYRLLEHPIQPVQSSGSFAWPLRY